jgi:hypothetical protein
VARESGERDDDRAGAVDESLAAVLPVDLASGIGDESQILESVTEDVQLPRQRLPGRLRRSVSRMRL